MTSLRTVLERAKELREAQSYYLAARNDPRATELELGERRGALTWAASEFDTAIVAYEAESKGATRAEVYAAIDSEREYQDRMWGGSEHDQHETVGNFLIYIERYLQRAKDAMVDSADQHERAALHHVRKIAALAVVCMEEHGAPKR